ncbi:UDP-N-acetylmuramate--L-alanine ligase [Prosthecochloris sp.]|uniref:UDP-N-acetylmuramate--L-alanine ligase n=1 Tax=Prosthecochloris sp. TaxID=290513 RepID=UPI002580A180|nr:UDP-N-acetylmuramate--L-alanine ligase [Prosthecochloris sp.]
MELGNTKCVHIVGIGGAGMSAIAELLLKSGLTVTGSDIAVNEVTEKLKEEGATVAKGHSEKNIGESDVVVYSSAISTCDNVEIAEALRKGVPVIKRDEMLGELMRYKSGICVAGTHGKTTTTAMIATMLIEAGEAPTVMIGGISDYLKGSTRVGDGRYMVIEADEYDRAFLRLTPSLAVINSLEIEHTDTYGGIEELREAFIAFANKVPFYGRVLCCVDWPEVRNIIPRLDRRSITYGIEESADFMARDIEVDRNRTFFTVDHQKKEMARFNIAVPGRHNVHNALAAIATGVEMGLPVERLVSGLAAFNGMRRRFQIRYGKEGGPVIIDDYAHHPSEVKAAVKAAKAGWQDYEVIAVFQPHLFSRTRDFSNEYGWALSNADSVIVTDVFAARENPDDFPGIDGALVSKAATVAGAQKVKFIPGKEELCSILEGYCVAGKLLLCMGAGSITRVAVELAGKCQRRNQ